MSCLQRPYQPLSHMYSTIIGRITARFPSQSDGDSNRDGEADEYNKDADDDDDYIVCQMLSSKTKNISFHQYIRCYGINVFNTLSHTTSTIVNPARVWS